MERRIGRDGAVRHDWTRAEIRELFALPFPDLIYQAQTLHRQNFDPLEVQVSTLLSIKTGGCPEDRPRQAIDGPARPVTSANLICYRGNISVRRLKN
jgi:hypothetical protein